MQWLIGRSLLLLHVGDDDVSQSLSLDCSSVFAPTTVDWCAETVIVALPVEPVVVAVSVVVVEHVAACSPVEVVDIERSAFLVTPVSDLVYTVVVVVQYDEFAVSDDV